MNDTKDDVQGEILPETSENEAPQEASASAPAEQAPAEAEAPAEGEQQAV
jgi:hypothetical protein